MITEQKIEQLLRSAPQPAPPADLKAKLIANVQLPPIRQDSIRRNTLAARGNWLRRWWPALAPAAISAACAIVISVQQTEIQALKQNIQALSQPAGSAPIAQNESNLSPGPGPTLPSGASEQQEIKRLTELVNQLRAEVMGLEHIRAENDKLRAQLADPSGYLTSEETAALDQAREKSQSIVCINNLKQLGLAAKIWALDNGGKFPADLLEMTNEMNTPKILHCPADSSRTEAPTFAGYTAANCSYEYLAPGGTDLEPNRVLWRCPIHGHIGLCDGSVQGGIVKEHPDWLIQREGKLYFQKQAFQQPNESADEFRRRYGLQSPSPTPSNQRKNP
jgi:hypothetical protein